MTDVEIVIEDVLGRAPAKGDRLWVRATRTRSGTGDQVIAPVAVPIEVYDNPVVDLTPGPAHIRFEMRGLAVDQSREFPVTIPEQGPVTLKEILASSYDWTPAEMTAFELVRMAANAAAAAADSAAGRSEVAADLSAAAEARVSIEHEHVHQDASHVDGVAAHVAGLLDQANTFVQDQVPPYLQKTELNSTYGPDAIQNKNSDVRKAIDGVAVGLAKEVGGGLVPRPMRPPTLAIERSFPSSERSGRFLPLWVDRATSTVYAMNVGDRAFVKSTDNGVTWEFKSKPPLNYSNGVFVKSPVTGTMLLGTSGSGPRLDRSTDDGATWTPGYQMPANSIFLGAQSVSVDAAGHFYAVEYTTNSSKTEILAVRSTDDGVTWHVLHAFPGPASSSPDKIRHIHSVQTDPISGRTFIMTGDSEAKAGIYVVDGDTVKPWLINDKLPVVRGGMIPRAIGMMFFPTHIAWASDSSAAAIYRVPRANETEVAVEEVYRISSTGWFSIRAADDNTRWLISSSDEQVNSRLDSAVHLYAVEDNGATVWEVATATEASSGFSAFAPVGMAESSGDEVWIKSHGFTEQWAVRGKLGYGGAPFPKPAQSTIPTWQTRSAGPITLDTTKTSEVIAQFGVPGAFRTLYIYDMGVHSTGSKAYIEVWNATTGERVRSDVWTDRPSEKFQGSRESAEYLYRIPNMTGYQAIQVRIYVTTGSTPGQAYGYITYGWSDR